MVGVMTLMPVVSLSLSLSANLCASGSPYPSGLPVWASGGYLHEDGSNSRVSQP